MFLGKDEIIKCSKKFCDPGSGNGQWTWGKVGNFQGLL